MVPNMYKSPTEPWFMGVFNVGGKWGKWLLFRRKQHIFTWCFSWSLLSSPGQSCRRSVRFVRTYHQCFRRLFPTSGNGVSDFQEFPPFQTEIDMMSWCRSSNLLGLWKKADDFLTLAKCIVLIRRNQRNGAVGNTVQGQISHTWESHLQFCGTQGTTILCWSCRPATPSWIWEEGRHKKFCFTTELDTPEKPPASLISRDLCRENHPGMSMVSNILQSTLIQKPTDSMISHDIRLRRGPPADKLRKNKDPCPQVGKGCPKLNINKVSTIAATTWCRHKHYFSHSPEKHVVARKTCWTLMNMSQKTGNIEHHIISYNII